MLAPLTANGLLPPPDFPAGPFERVYLRVRQRSTTQGALFEHFGGAWNAVSMRYMAMTAHGGEFTRLITAQGGTAPVPHDRYEQENALFGLFANGFSTLESYFYGMFAVGALLHPADFPLATAKERQAVSPSSTGVAYGRSFAGDPVLAVFDSVFKDSAYRQFREVRNILTHRTAPGRTIYVGIESDEELPARWKINDVPLDSSMAANRRSEVASLLTNLMEAAATFVEARIP